MWPKRARWVQDGKGGQEEIGRISGANETDWLMNLSVFPCTASAP